MRIEEELKLDFQDVLIRPKRSTLTSRSEVDISREFVFRHSGQSYHGVPIIAANMDTVGTFEMARVLTRHQLAAALHKHYEERELISFFQTLPEASTVFYSMGITREDYEKFCRVKDQVGDAIAYVCVDVANGYTKSFVDFLHRLREAWPQVTIMAGNVVTGEMTGIGYPQLSAIIECADAAHGLGGLICADGGCTSPGDLAKAFGGGADFIMLGGMLAGHDECMGEVAGEEGARKVRFYGMSSRTAMDKHAGGVANYRASEGKEVLLDYRGPVEDTLQEILGGVRSACTYVGAHKLRELSKRTTFIRVARQLNEVFGQS